MNKLLVSFSQIPPHGKVVVGNFSTFQTIGGAGRLFFEYQSREKSWFLDFPQKSQSREQLLVEFVPSPKPSNRYSSIFFQIPVHRKVVVFGFPQNHSPWNSCWWNFYQVPGYRRVVDIFFQHPIHREEGVHRFFPKPQSMEKLLLVNFPPPKPWLVMERGFSNSSPWKLCDNLFPLPHHGGVGTFNFLPKSPILPQFPQLSRHSIWPPDWWFLTPNPWERRLSKL